MTGNFSTELSAAGAGVPLCAEAPAAARAGSHRPRSLREIFIGRPPSGIGRRSKHYTPAALSRPAVSHKRWRSAAEQALDVCDVQIAERTAQAFPRRRPAFGEFQIA